MGDQCRSGNNQNRYGNTRAKAAKGALETVREAARIALETVGTTVTAMWASMLALVWDFTPPVCSCIRQRPLMLSLGAIFVSRSCLSPRRTSADGGAFVSAAPCLSLRRRGGTWLCRFSPEMASRAPDARWD